MMHRCSTGAGRWTDATQREHAMASYCRMVAHRLSLTPKQAARVELLRQQRDAARAVYKDHVADCDDCYDNEYTEEVAA